MAPKVIVLQAGTNNLPARGPADDAVVEDVVGGIEAILATCREKAPDAVVVLTGLFPRPQNKALAPAIARINDRLATLADGKRVRFLNINDRLTGENGDLLPGVSRDGLHLEETGYDVRAKHPAIGKWLERIQAMPGWRGPYECLPGERIPPRRR